MTRPAARRRRAATAGALTLTALLALIALWLPEPLHRRGLEARQSGNLSAAARCHTWAWRLRPTSALRRLEAAESQQLAGDFRRSERLLAPLLDEPTIPPPLRARALLAAGVNDFHRARPHQALAHYQASLELAREMSDLGLELRATVGRARVLYHSLGKPRRAIEQLESVLARAKDAGEAGIADDARRHLGAVHWWYEGETAEPLTRYYLPALAGYRRRGDRRGEATTLANISLLVRHSGDPLLALRDQTRSLDLRRAIGDQAGESESLRHLGELWVSLGNFRKGRDAFAASLEIGRRIGYDLSADEAELGLSHAAGKLGEPRAAIAIAQRLLDRPGRKASVSTKYTLASLAQWHLALGDPQAAERSLLAARELDTASGAGDSAFEVASLTTLAEAALQAENRAAARSLLARAEAASGDDEALRTTSGLRRIQAELARREGHRTEALGLLAEAVEAELGSLPADATGLVAPSFPELYDPLFALLLETRPDSAAERIFSYLERLRHRDTLGRSGRAAPRPRAAAAGAEPEQRALAGVGVAVRELGRTADGLAAGRLDRAYGDYEDLVLREELAERGTAAPAPSLPAELAEVQAALDPATALLIYLPVEGRLHVLAIRADRAEVTALPLASDQLELRVSRFRDLIAAGSPTSEPRPPDLLEVASDLYGRLVGPAERSGILDGVERLGILPFGALHDLPFAALSHRVANGDRFLIEDYALFQPPSATAFARAVSVRDTPSGPQTVLALGIRRPSQPGVPALAHAAAEAETVVELLGGRALIDADATETALKALAPRYRYLHLATHGRTEERMPLLSNLALEPTSADDGWLSVREVLRLPIHADLVSLGACGSGRGTSPGGHADQLDRLGLAEAFLIAGADHVVASHLDVADATSLDLMTSFYGELEALGPAEALARAQRAMLGGRGGSGSSPDSRHPRHWAPYFLLGAPD